MKLNVLSEMFDNDELSKHLDKIEWSIGISGFRDINIKELLNAKFNNKLDFLKNRLIDVLRYSTNQYWITIPQSNIQFFSDYIDKAWLSAYVIDDNAFWENIIKPKQTTKSDFHDDDTFDDEASRGVHPILIYDNGQLTFRRVNIPIPLNIKKRYDTYLEKMRTVLRGELEKIKKDPTTINRYYENHNLER